MCAIIRALFALLKTKAIRPTGLSIPKGEKRKKEYFGEQIVNILHGLSYTL